MIELRRIREYKIAGRTKKADKPFSPEIFVEQLSDLFDEVKLQDIIKQIPDEERFNCYYTLGHAPQIKESDSRAWSHQEVIPFDIDDCEYVNDKPHPKYLPVIAETLGVDIKKCVVVATGNGLQVLVKPNAPLIAGRKFFDTNSKFYSALLSKLELALKANGLKGQPDVSAFQPNRLFRLPHTYNIKKDKPKRIARILSGHLETIDFDLAKASGIPSVEESDALTDKELKHFKIDSASVLSGCDFIKFAKDNAATLQEPAWYALLSILGRLDNGEALAHDYSKAHPNYSATDTTKKLKQALDASGPRTCDNINKFYGNCKSCPNFCKVNSPISLKSPEFIATSNTGFHSINPTTQRLSPQYEDLRKFYGLEHHYVNTNGSHYIYNGTHYQERHESCVEAFAQKHFRPTCTNHMANEFRGIIKRSNTIDHEFFTDSTNRKLNLQNGVLDIDTLTLTPHTTSLGFRYVLPFAYDPIAPAPLFTKLLANVTRNDDNLQKILLEYMGYSISNDDPIAQKFLLLTGEGSNGKSTFIKVLAALGGPGVKTLSEKQLMNSFDLVNLDGALMNIIEETPRHIEDVFWERVKHLSAGGRVLASKKFKDAYEFNCKAKFILIANELPRGGTPSHGLYRRFIIVPFNAKFSPDAPDFDRDIDHKIIESEMPGVLNLVLDAYHRLKANRYAFTKSEQVDAAIEAYKELTDPFSEWCKDYVAASESVQSYVATADLYSLYRTTTEAEGLRPMALRVFVPKVIDWANKHGIKAEKGRIRTDEDRTMVVYGLKLSKTQSF